MRFGKLSANELDECVLQQINSIMREEVRLFASHGEDCAALKIEDLVLLSTDPITAKMPLKELGSLAVDVACNDIIANGGEPIALMLTIIVTPQNSTSDIKVIMQSASKRAKELSVNIIGGHTEFSDCVTRPLISVTAIGSSKKLFKKTDLRDGSKIFMTKHAAIEGTLILSQSINVHFTDSEKAVLNELEKKLSVKAEGQILKQDSAISTMHDITEGGVIGAVAELVKGAGLGAEIFKDQIPLLSITEKICKQAKIDPLRLISSGSLLFTATGDISATINRLQKEGINVQQIGQVVQGNEIKLISSDGKYEVVASECDHLFKN